jgi:hypothetical protein
MPRAKKAEAAPPKKTIIRSPVKIGEKVFVVQDTFKVSEAMVTSNPGDHIWVQETNAKTGHFVGPDRWDKTEAGARKKAVSLIDETIDTLHEKIVSLQSLRKTMQKKVVA